MRRKCLHPRAELFSLLASVIDQVYLPTHKAPFFFVILFKEPLFDVIRRVAYIYRAMHSPRSIVIIALRKGGKGGGDAYDYLLTSEDFATGAAARANDCVADKAREDYIAVALRARAVLSRGIYRYMYTHVIERRVWVLLEGLFR